MPLELGQIHAGDARGRCWHGGIPAAHRAVGGGREETRAIPREDHAGAAAFVSQQKGGAPVLRTPREQTARRTVRAIAVERLADERIAVVVIGGQAFGDGLQKVEHPDDGIRPDDGDQRLRGMQRQSRHGLPEALPPQQRPAGGRLRDFKIMRGVIEWAAERGEVSAIG